MGVKEIDVVKLNKVADIVVSDARMAVRATYQSRTRGWFKNHDKIPASLNILESYTSACMLRDTLDVYITEIESATSVALGKPIKNRGVGIVTEPEKNTSLLGKLPKTMREWIITKLR
jgi:hypothetical protein